MSLLVNTKMKLVAFTTIILVGKHDLAQIATLWVKVQRHFTGNVKWTGV